MVSADPTLPAVDTKEAVLLPSPPAQPTWPTEDDDMEATDISQAMLTSDPVVHNEKAAAQHVEAKQSPVFLPHSFASVSETRYPGHPLPQHFVETSRKEVVPASHPQKLVEVKSVEEGYPLKTPTKTSRFRPKKQWLKSPWFYAALLLLALIVAAPFVVYFLLYDTWPFSPKGHRQDHSLVRDAFHQAQNGTLRNPAMIKAAGLVGATMLRPSEDGYLDLSPAKSKDLHLIYLMMSNRFRTQTTRLGKRTMLPTMALRHATSMSASAVHDPFWTDPKAIFAALQNETATEVQLLRENAYCGTLDHQDSSFHEQPCCVTSWVGPEQKKASATVPKNTTYAIMMCHGRGAMHKLMPLLAQPEETEKVEHFTDHGVWTSNAEMDGLVLFSPRSLETDRLRLEDGYTFVGALSITPPAEKPLYLVGQSQAQLSGLAQGFFFPFIWLSLKKKMSAIDTKRVVVVPFSSLSAKNGSESCTADMLVEDGRLFAGLRSVKWMRDDEASSLALLSVDHLTGFADVTVKARGQKMMLDPTKRRCPTFTTLLSGTCVDSKMFGETELQVTAELQPLMFPREGEKKTFSVMVSVFSDILGVTGVGIPVNVTVLPTSAFTEPASTVQVSPLFSTHASSMTLLPLAESVSSTIEVGPDGWLVLNVSSTSLDALSRVALRFSSPLLDAAVNDSTYHIAEELHLRENTLLASPNFQSLSADSVELQNYARLSWNVPGQMLFRGLMTLKPIPLNKTVVERPLQPYCDMLRTILPFDESIREKQSPLDAVSHLVDVSDLKTAGAAEMRNFYASLRHCVAQHKLPATFAFCPNCTIGEVIAFRMPSLFRPADLSETAKRAQEGREKMFAKGRSMELDESVNRIYMMDSYFANTLFDASREVTVSQAAPDANLTNAFARAFLVNTAEGKGANGSVAENSDEHLIRRLVQSLQLRFVIDGQSPAGVALRQMAHYPAMREAFAVNTGVSGEEEIWVVPILSLFDHLSLGFQTNGESTSALGAFTDANVHWLYLLLHQAHQMPLNVLAALALTHFELEGGDIREPSMSVATWLQQVLLAVDPTFREKYGDMFRALVIKFLEQDGLKHTSVNRYMSPLEMITARIVAAMWAPVDELPSKSMMSLMLKALLPKEHPAKQNVRSAKAMTLLGKADGLAWKIRDAIS